MDQAWNNLLRWISRLRVPAELGTSKVPRRKMDEVCLTHFAWSSVVLNRRISSLNILIWGVVLCFHAACKNFAGLFAARLVFGICEGSVTAGFLIVSSMFYTRREHTVRVGYCCKDSYHPYFALFLMLYQY